MKKSLLLFALTGIYFILLPCSHSYAQEKATVATAAVPVAGVLLTEAQVSEIKMKSGENMNFSNIFFSSGWFVLLLWIGLFGCAIACTGLIIDSFINIREHRIEPNSLVQNINTAISQGDLAQAIDLCEHSESPLGRILKSGFLNLQEGFEVVQDSVGVSADIESEALLARISYLKIISKITPVLGLMGLIGTVQGVIPIFLMQNANPEQQAILASGISNGLLFMSAGLGISIPASIIFHFFKNRSMRIILDMKALTLEITKSLRNAVVVEDEQM